MILVVEGRQFYAIRRSGFYNSPGIVRTPSSHDQMEGTIYVLLRNQVRDRAAKRGKAGVRSRVRKNIRSRILSYGSEPDNQ